MSNTSVEAEEIFAKLEAGTLKREDIHTLLSMQKEGKFKEGKLKAPRKPRTPFPRCHNVIANTLTSMFNVKHNNDVCM